MKSEYSDADTPVRAELALEYSLSQLTYSTPDDSIVTENSEYHNTRHCNPATPNGEKSVVKNVDSRQGSASRSQWYPQYKGLPFDSANKSDRKRTLDENKYEYVLGVVNPASGDVTAANHVLRSMRLTLGFERVVQLDGPLFANPAPLQEAIRNYAVRFIREETESCSGMNSNNKENINEMSGIHVGHTTNENRMERRGTLIVSGGDGTISFVMEQLDRVREIIDRTSSYCTATEGVASRSSSRLRFVLPALAVIPLGTGNDCSLCLGFGGGYSLHKGGMCCCPENLIEPLIDDALSAPSVPFDRWVARLAPLTSIVEQQRGRGEEAQQRKQQIRHPRVLENSMKEIRHIDWDALDAGGNCLRYTFINYFSIGYDAYVLQKFDAFRKKYPEVCRKRWRNKLVYAMYGLKAAFCCSPLSSLISAVCVPNPVGVSTMSSDGAQIPLLPLAMPTESKVLLVTNVNKYAAGTSPWQVEKGPMHRVGYGTHEPKAGASMLTPVSINDHKVEVQSLGGAMDMTLLQVGFGAANKMAQSRELFAFVLCTPEDLLDAGKTVQADFVTSSLAVQVDGEAVTRIVQPTVVQITELRRPRLYVRCRNPAVVRQTAMDQEEEILN